MPQGVTVTTADGSIVEITDVQRLPDKDGMRVWLARVPPGTRLAANFRFGRKVLPGRTALQVDLADAVLLPVDGNEAAPEPRPEAELTGRRGLVGFFRSRHGDLSERRRRRAGE